MADEEKKIIIDHDWKQEAQKEKDQLAAEQEAEKEKKADYYDDPPWGVP